MSDSPLSHWQRCYLAVEAEVDSDKLRDRIYEARSSLIARYKELASLGGSASEAERCGLQEAARGLRDAEVTRLGYAEAVGDEGRV